MLTNCEIFTSQSILTGHSLVLEDGIIQDIIIDQNIKKSDRQVDLMGLLLTPGFIDTQVNGGAGVLFNDAPSIESIAAIGNAHRTYGTTGFLPTLISDDPHVMLQAIAASHQALKEKVPGFIGLHLEGPYLNKIRKGVHRETKLHSPNKQSLDILNELGNIGTSMVTLAPEVVPAGFIKRLLHLGIIVSIGHSDATYDCIKESLRDGATGFTHLFNAMSPMTGRQPGVVGAALEDTNSWCGIIVDNFHVHPASLKIAINAKPPGKVMLVTDAVQSVGAIGHKFNLFGRNIYRKNGKVTTAEGILAGSDLNMESAVRNCVNLLKIELEEALRMASLYPAQFLGIDHHLGKISIGYTANLNLLNNKLEVVESWIDGYSSKDIKPNSHSGSTTSVST